MTMTLKELRELRAQKLEAAKALKAKASSEKREPSDEEFAEIQARLDESDAIHGQIEALVAERQQVLEGIEQKISDLAKSAGARTQTVAASVQVLPKDETAVTSELRERVHDDPARGYSGCGGFGRFAADVHSFNRGYGMPEGLRPMAAAGTGMSAGIKSDGGVLVPPAFSTAIQDRMAQSSNSLLQMTDQLPPLPDGTESMEYPATNETSRADGSRSGGIQGRWKSELTGMTESAPTLRSVKFTPSELYVFAYISDKLLRHAPQLEAFLIARAGDEINFKIGDGIINGTGAGQPRGILSGATNEPRVQIAKETGQAAATLNTTNLEKMYARMPSGSATASWLINQDVLPQLLALTKSVGSGGLPVFLPAGNIASAPFGTIYGRPIVPIEYCPTLGTEGDIIFADMTKYGTMARGTVQAGMSIHLKFDFNQTAFRFIFEMDGQPWATSAITPFKGTAKQSPFVTLALRA